MDDAIAPPQVLNVMPIRCDAGVHLGGEPLSRQIRTVPQSRLRRTADRRARSRVSARLIEFGIHRRIVSGTVRHQPTPETNPRHVDTCASGWTNTSESEWKVQQCLGRNIANNQAKLTTTIAPFQLAAHQYKLLSNSTN